ncbi:hypothetical protein [Fusibacter sp. 3D3]|uniref:hypothetical protein n=1 Tax=Fusibacter sp. 3D3 TaxID=1048380 RepID=UPI000853E7D0|nr:hypothetical protein [Fusibacter sp. 3D3]GAU77757.1 hypothetical protein F3D3_2386 [Fusibacter sp. 3D3]
MKKKISIFLIISMLLQLTYGISIAEDEGQFLDYDDNYNAFIMLTDVPMATNGYAFRTVGVKLTAPIENGEALTIYMPMTQIGNGEERQVEGKTWVKTEFHIKLDEIYKQYKTFYGNDPERSDGLERFFGNDNIMVVDAILAPVLSGQVQGQVTSASTDLGTGYIVIRQIKSTTISRIV